VAEPRKRWPTHAVWGGLAIAFVGVISYFLYFAQFPSLRDVPWVNLPVAWFGAILAGAGGWQVLRRGRGVVGKGLAGVGFLLAFGLAGLFSWYVFSFSYHLPESAEAAAVQAVAPDFALLDQDDREVSLSDFRGKNVVLVFYRGFW